MRSLTSKEVETVTGAGYAEDITTAAATAITAAGISTISGLMGGIVLGNTSFAIAISTGGVVSRTGFAISGFAVGAVLGPVLAGARLFNTHPEYATVLKEKFHHYFG
ncbi:MAG: hypothetical protein JSS07_12515 [Proteobacteria bacterium]|nr:hypothetical protein [Pseudomonadota bacterium]